MANTKLNIVVSATDKASGPLKKVGGALGGIGKFAAKAAVVGIAAAGAAVAGLTVGVAKLVMEAPKLQGLEDAFKGFAGTDASKLIGQLQDTSKGMISNTELMTSFNKAAQLVSVDFAERLPDAMGMLGKVAAATGQDMGFLLDSLVTGVGRLSPMILDNLGIQIDLVAAQEVYALSIGKTVSELTKAEQQTALMNQVMEKLTTNTANLADVIDPFKQLQVTFTNLKDTASKAIGKTMLPLVQKFSDALFRFVKSETFNKWLDAAVGKIGDVATRIMKFGENFINLAKYIGLAVSEGDPLNDFLANLPSWIQPVVQWVGGLAAKFGEWKDRVSEYIGNVKSAWTVFVDTIEKRGLSGLFDEMEDGRTVLQGLLENLGLGSENAGAFAEALEGVYDFIVGNLIPAFEEFGEIVMKIIDEDLTPAFERLKTMAGEAVASLKSDWDENGNALIQSFKDLHEAIKLASDTLGFDMWDALGKLIPPLGILQDIWADFFKTSSDIEGLIPSLTEKIANATNWLIDLIQRYREAQGMAPAPGIPIPTDKRPLTPPGGQPGGPGGNWLNPAPTINFNAPIYGVNSTEFAQQLQNTLDNQNRRRRQPGGR